MLKLVSQILQHQKSQSVRQKLRWFLSIPLHAVDVGLHWKRRREVTMRRPICMEGLLLGLTDAVLTKIVPDKESAQTTRTFTPTGREILIIQMGQPSTGTRITTITEKSPTCKGGRGSRVLLLIWMEAVQMVLL
jgi:hypothetical protein